MERGLEESEREEGEFSRSKRKSYMVSIFTIFRSISNPEMVMRRRRQLKLEKKLQTYRSTDGGPDTGEEENVMF